LSVTLDIYPEVVLVGQGLHILVRNPTSTDQDITVRFYDGSTEFAGVVFTGVKSGESRNLVIPSDVLGLDGKVGKTVTAVATIPTPPSGTYLLGSNLTPSTSSNAVAVTVASSVEVSVTDNYGRPVPYVKVNLFDEHGLKAYTYVGDVSGRVRIPDRPTPNYGRWLLEVVKYDPDNQLVCYNLIPDYDFSSKSVTCVWARNYYVEIQLNAVRSDISYIDTVRNLTSWLPQPIKSFINWLASRLGLGDEATLNATLVSAIHEVINKNGGNVVLVKQEGDKLRIGFTVGYGSPFAWATLIPVIAGIIKWLIAFGIAYVISSVIISYSPVKVAEVTNELATQQSAILTKLKEAYDSGALDTTTYNEAVRNYSEAFKTFTNNLPSTGVGITSVITLMTLALVVVLAVSVIKVLGSD
jgi:hypothetical protein